MTSLWAQRKLEARLAILAGIVPSLPIRNPESPWGAFFRELNARGWTEGGNLKVEPVRRGLPDVIPRQTAEVVASRPDVILTDTSSVIQELRKRTSTIPIVFHLVGYPDELGLVASLARPGGNVTGAAGTMPALHTKWIELLRELIPGLRRLGLLWAPLNPASNLQHAKYQGAATEAGIELVSLPVTPDTFRNWRAKALEAKVQALHVHSLFDSADNYSWAAEHKIPAMGDTRLGALLSYSPDVVEQFEASARHVAMILDGKSPADLPVVLPRRFRLRINMRTARALGVDLPRAFRIRVDEFVDE